MEEIQQKLRDENYAFIDGQNLNLAIRDSGWNELKNKMEFKGSKMKRTS